MRCTRTVLASLGSPVNAGVDAAGLKTALWRCDPGAELPLLADQRQKAEVHDRPLLEGLHRCA